MVCKAFRLEIRKVCSDVPPKSDVGTATPTFVQNGTMLKAGKSASGVRNYHIRIRIWDSDTDLPSDADMPKNPEHTACRSETQVQFGVNQLTRRSVLRMIQCSTPPELPSCPSVPRVLRLPLVAASRYTAQSHRLSVCSSLFRMSNAQPLSIHMCCALCIAHAVFHYEYFKHRYTLHHLSFGVRPGLEH